MSLSATSHQQYFARSLSALHLDQPCDDSDSDGSNINISKRDRRGEAIRRNRISLHTTPPVPSGRRVSFAHPISGDGLPELPFSPKDTERDSSREYPSRNFQRHRSAVTNTKLTEARRKERLNLMEARILEDQSIELCRDYELGETIRCPSHMTPKDTDTLEKHDFAFVKRSDGSYSYAILAYRTYESMVFVMDDTGATKRIGIKKWSNFVRLVAR